MNILQKIQIFFDSLDEKRFYTYASIFLGLSVLISGSIIFYRYRSINYLKRQLNNVNDMREEIRRILDEAQHVQQQRTEVNTMLEEDPNFKIGGYFIDLLANLGLSEKTKLESTSQVDKDDEYRESILNAKLTEMDMKELTELLNAIEQTPRIYMKELEITKTKKNGHTIDVDLIIATLQKKAIE